MHAQFARGPCAVCVTRITIALDLRHFAFGTRPALSTRMVLRTDDPKNPRVLLETDHRELSARLERLVLLLREDDPGAAIKAWQSFEEALLAHFDVEEMYVFKALEEDNPVEIRALREDHDALRRAAGALGLAFELHTIRLAMFDAFSERLRVHAEREESLLYPHAERHLAVAIARAIFQRLRGAPAEAKNARKRARRRLPMRTSTKPLNERGTP